MITPNKSSEDNRQMQAAMADPDPRFEFRTIADVEYSASSI